MTDNVFREFARQPYSPDIGSVNNLQEPFFQDKGFQVPDYPAMKCGSKELPRLWWR